LKRLSPVLKKRRWGVVISSSATSPR
jgi:hypothetical protein